MIACPSFLPQEGKETKTEDWGGGKEIRRNKMGVKKANH